MQGHGVQQVLEVLQEGRRVPAVGGGVGDVPGEGHGLPAVLRHDLPAGDHREEGGEPVPGHRGGIAGEVQPGRRGDAVEVGGLAGLGLDAVVGAVGLHVGEEAAVERGKVLVMLRPQVGEGVVVFVKDGVVGVEHVVTAGVPVPVHPHPAGRVGQEGVGDAPDEAGVELQALGPGHGVEVRHVQPDSDGVATGEEGPVVVKMLSNFPIMCCLLNVY